MAVEEAPAPGRSAGPRVGPAAEAPLGLRSDRPAVGRAPGGRPRSRGVRRGRAGDREPHAARLRPRRGCRRLGAAGRGPRPARRGGVPRRAPRQPPAPRDPGPDPRGAARGRRPSRRSRSRWCRRPGRRRSRPRSGATRARPRSTGSSAGAPRAGPTSPCTGRSSSWRGDTGCPSSERISTRPSTRRIGRDGLGAAGRRSRRGFARRSRTIRCGTRRSRGGSGRPTATGSARAARPGCSRAGTRATSSSRGG